MMDRCRGDQARLLSVRVRVVAVVSAVVLLGSLAVTDAAGAAFGNVKYVVALTGSAVVPP